MSFKPIDARRDEYRKYLEHTGVMDMLSKAIMKLFECPEKPENAIEFIRSNMGDSLLDKDTIEHLKHELEDTRNEVAQLKRQIDTLKVENAKLTSNPPSQEAKEVKEVIVSKPVTVEVEQPKSEEDIKNNEQIITEPEVPVISASNSINEQETAPAESVVVDEGNNEVANEEEKPESAGSEVDEKKESEQDSEKKDNATEKGSESPKAE